MITLYGYKKCGTCRKGEKLLNDNAIEYEFIDITVNPPKQEILAKIIQQSGKPLKKFFNTSGVLYREMQLKDKLADMTEVQMLELLATNGKLIKRPILSDGNKSTVAFNEEELTTVWLK